MGCLRLRFSLLLIGMSDDDDDDEDEESRLDSFSFL